jgi:hypothetical protein
MKPVFTSADCGCIGDGAFGHEHIRAALGTMLEKTADVVKGACYVD